MWPHVKDWMNCAKKSFSFHTFLSHWIALSKAQNEREQGESKRKNFSRKFSWIHSSSNVMKWKKSRASFVSAKKRYFLLCLIVDTEFSVNLLKRNETISSKTSLDDILSFFSSIAGCECTWRSSTQHKSFHSLRWPLPKILFFNNNWRVKDHHHYFYHFFSSSSCWSPRFFPRWSSHQVQGYAQALSY